MKTEEIVHLLENVYKYNISELSIKSGDEKIIIKNGIDGYCSKVCISHCKK